MQKTLLIVVHEQLEKSVFNKALLDAVQGIQELDIQPIGQTWDIAQEQELLEKYPKIILQSPFLWYAVSAKLKNYLEKVCCQGFAFGSA